MERIMAMETLETTMEAMSTALASILGMITLVTSATLGMQILGSTMEQSTMERTMAMKILETTMGTTSTVTLMGFKTLEPTMGTITLATTLEMETMAVTIGIRKLQLPQLL